MQFLSLQELKFKQKEKREDINLTLSNPSYFLPYEFTMVLIGSTQQNAGPEISGTFQVMTKVYLQSYMKLYKLLYQSGLFEVLAEFLVCTKLKKSNPSHIETRKSY